MADVISAGILLYRRASGRIEVLLAHPGGPLWARRDEGAWSLPKGEAGPGEELPAVARREFAEELGAGPPGGDLLPLGSVVQRSGKEVFAWAACGDFDPERLVSNTFAMEWPPRSGRTADFPEIDRVAWFTVEEARARLNPAQAAFLDRLLERLAGPK